MVITSLLQTAGRMIRKTSWSRLCRKSRSEDWIKLGTAGAKIESALVWCLCGEQRQETEFPAGEESWAMSRQREMGEQWGTSADSSGAQRRAGVSSDGTLLSAFPVVVVSVQSRIIPRCPPGMLVFPLCGKSCILGQAWWTRLTDSTTLHLELAKGTWRVWIVTAYKLLEVTF